MLIFPESRVKGFRKTLVQPQRFPIATYTHKKGVYKKKAAKVNIFFANFFVKFQRLWPYIWVVKVFRTLL
jgi:hypothetical protein